MSDLSVRAIKVLREMEHGKEIKLFMVPKAFLEPKGAVIPVHPLADQLFRSLKSLRLIEMARPSCVSYRIAAAGKAALEGKEIL